MAAMGIGRLGSPDLVFKRNNRFLFSIETPVGAIPPHYVKTAARPKWQTSATEVHYLNDITYLPGKVRYEPITVSYNEVSAGDAGVLHSWLAAVRDHVTGQGARQSERPGWNATCQLMMLDGCGSPMEYWQLKGCFPESADFGQLDHADDGVATATITIRYDGLQYRNICGPSASASCRGC